MMLGPPGAPAIIVPTHRGHVASPPVETAGRAEQRTGRRRIVPRLPVPQPLREAVAAGRFGYDEGGRPIRPGPEEVRAITEQHAERLAELIALVAAGELGVLAEMRERRGCDLRTAVAAYAEDFGDDAAERLEAYARRQAMADAPPTRGRGRGC